MGTSVIVSAIKNKVRKKSILVWVIKYVATLTMDKQGLVVTLNTTRRKLNADELAQLI